jgi:outer membrane protein, heavy metal efflux system
MEYNFTDGSFMFSVLQTLPSPFKYFPSVSAARAGRDLASTELRMKKLEVLSDVKKAFFEYWLSMKKKALAGETLEYMKQFAASAASLYGSGKTGQEDVLKFQTEIERLNNILIMAEADEKTSAMRLSTAVGLTQSVLVDKPGDTGSDDNSVYFFNKIPVLDENEYVSSLIPNLGSESADKLPEILASRLSEKKALSEYRAAAGSWAPDIMAGVKADTMKNTTLMLGAAIPLWFWKQAADVSKAKHEYEAVRFSSKQQILEIVTELKTVTLKLRAFSVLLKRYQQTILPLSQQALNLSRTSYALGKGSFFDLSDSTDGFIKDRLDYYENMNQAAMLEADYQRMTDRFTPEANP